MRFGFGSELAVVLVLAAACGSHVTHADDDGAHGGRAQGGSGANEAASGGQAGVMPSAGDSSAPLGVLDLSGLDASALAYPAPPGVDAARASAETIVARMTLTETATLLYGGAGGIIGGTSAAGPIPALSYDDGPGGVAHVSGATAFPDPITLAATWDRDLVERWAEAMGAEERAKGVAVQLGPMLNLSRVPLAGRNFESFGEDPYLSAELAFADVRGIQSNHIVATAKHFVGNEQETNRTSEDSRIDERTLHEVYYLPFEASVSAGVGSVMCSYNKVNGLYACENPDTLGDLKGTLGFSGWVMTDWGAAHGSGAAAAGLDQEMPSASYFTASSLAGTRVDDMATRLVTSLVRVGVLDDPPTGVSYADVTSAEHTALAREAASVGTTLLKDDAHALPFGNDVKSIIVLGAAGGDTPYSTGAGSGEVTAAHVTSPLEAITARAPAGTSVTYVRGDVESDASAAAADADAAVIVVAVASGEFLDRQSLSLDAESDALISAVAAVNPRTIVVLDVPGAVMMPWLDAVSGVVVAWYPGQENGNALAALLFGDVNPSGKLPVSFPSAATDLPAPGPGTSVLYSEGLALGYRGLDSAGLDPLFEFGFGLSYTTFAYDGLELRSGEKPGSVDVSFQLTNTGTFAGCEVAQVYVSFPPKAGEPPRVLRGFERVELEPGEARRVHIELPARAFSCWSATAHARYVPSGSYTVSVGSSSRRLPLAASFEVVGVGEP
ncbi:MAG TPA: glycoside hydrolase family 3 C-terminal domain-containing protein [Polyangiaceae bacterium]|nr:glycoside hydrolase family 3 C-terminal domain-containing protein [Polyangiaceae bacterium]